MLTTEAAVAAKPWLETYQPLIVGLVGVTLGLVANTVLLLVKQAFENGRLADVARLALSSELQLHLKTQRRIIELTSESRTPDRELRVRIEPQFHMFDVYSGSIGHLKKAEVTAVVEAYAYMRALPEWLVDFAVIKTVGPSTLALLPSGHRTKIHEIYVEIAAKVDHAVKVLGRH